MISATESGPPSPTRATRALRLTSLVLGIALAVTTAAVAVPTLDEHRAARAHLEAVWDIWFGTTAVSSILPGEKVTRFTTAVEGSNHVVTGIESEAGRETGYCYVLAADPIAGVRNETTLARRAPGGVTVWSEITEQQAELYGLTASALAVIARRLCQL